VDTDKPLEEKSTRRRGRPKGSVDRKIRLKATPKTAPEEYAKMLGHIGLVAVYGIDEFTMELIRYMWNDPHQEFVVTDPIDAILSKANFEMGSRAYSEHRWSCVSHVGFVETGVFPVVVAADKYHKELVKIQDNYLKQNPGGNDTYIINISKWDKW